MKKQETTIRVLEQFLPPRTFDLVAPFFVSHTIHLTLTHERKSVLGDYRNPTTDKPYHRISVNANLNQYSFLITLLHELAHLLTFVHFKHTVSPHGKEWKTQFRHILIPFIGKGFFPKDVEKALIDYIHNPAASTCTDPNLYKALYRYDERKPGYRLVDELALNARFAIEDGRIFEKVEILRTRSKCREVKTGRMYYFQGIVEVKAL
ncbi:SprT-like domain-containing protein [Chitinophagaceae bacterium MMS25-I14]